MKTLNKNHRKTKAGWKLGRVVALVLISILISACGKKGKDGGGGTTGVTPTVPGSGQGCINNCGNYTTMVASGLGKHQGLEVVELGMSLYGTAGTGNAASYSGPVTAAGYMAVDSTFSNSQCALRVGMYYLRVASANGSFSWQNQFHISNLNLEAVHTDGTVVLLSVRGDFYGQPQLGRDGFQHASRFWGDVSVRSIAGIQCNFNLHIPRVF